MKKSMPKRNCIHRIVSLIKENRKIYCELIINDFRSRYTGSFLGMLWGFIQPVVTILIYWLVFQYGLRSGERPDGIPYVLYMIPGAVPLVFLFGGMGRYYYFAS